MGHAEKIWLRLLALTAAGAWLGETAHAGWLLTIVVSGLIYVKGRLVIDHFMEANMAEKRIRRVLYTFVGVVSLMVLLSQAWGEAWLRTLIL